MEIRVRVGLFGHYAEAGSQWRDIRLLEGSKVSDLAQVMERRDERLAGLGTVCRAAVNESYAIEDLELYDGDEVAFLPPMSGG